MSIWKTELSFKQLWYYLLIVPAKWLLRIITVVALVAYVIIGIGGMSNIVKREINKTQDVSHLKEVIDDAIFNNELEDISKWVMYRPISETSQIIEIVKPYNSDVSAMLFFKISAMLLEQGKKDEALFWHLLAKYRLRYDMLRCGAQEAIDKFEEFVAKFQSEQVVEMLDVSASKTKETIAKVLEFDAKYPPENTIDYACSITTALEEGKSEPIAEDNWKRVREMLRQSAEEFVKSK